MKLPFFRSLPSQTVILNNFNTILVIYFMILQRTYNFFGWHYLVVEVNIAKLSLVVLEFTPIIFLILIFLRLISILGSTIYRTIGIVVLHENFFFHTLDLLK